MPSNCVNCRPSARVWLLKLLTKIGSNLPRFSCGSLTLYFMQHNYTVVGAVQQWLSDCAKHILCPASRLNYSRVVIGPGFEALSVFGIETAMI
jgi:hypothetical protein